MDQSVSDYLDHLPSPQQDICRRVREIILRSFPELHESFKNGVPWYEGLFYLASFTDHVNLGFAVKGLNDEQLALFEGKGQFMRHIKINSLDGLDEEKILNCLRTVKKYASCEG